MYSIYHFFAHLIRNKQHFRQDEKLEDFPFDIELLSSQNQGQFPHLSIPINLNQLRFTGGELIELKDSKTYSISSFNSTIPSGTKDIRKVVGSKRGKIYKKMTQKGDDVFSLLERQVFYLVRGRRGNDIKVCLIHGSFFETVKVDQLIRSAFEQVLGDFMRDQELEARENLKSLLTEIFPDQESFSKVRDVENASVKLRFRIMTEAKSEGNILDTKRYPQITDNTLNLIVPCHSSEVEAQERERIRIATSITEANALRVFKIKHLLNGEFVVFQTDIGASE